MGLVAPCGVAWAQAPTAEIPAPRFDITRFDVVGNTLLKPEEIQRAVAPYTGKQKDFSDIQRALEAVLPFESRNDDIALLVMAVRP